NYLYSTGEHDLWVHSYPQNTASVTVGEVEVNMRLHSAYPWDGDIEFDLNPSAPFEFSLHLRIPGWCDRWSVQVNGEPVSDLKPDNGYITVTRRWQPGDHVHLNLAMPVQAVWAHPAVRQMQGRVAIQRGPVIYCLEGIDHPGVENLDRISL